jgi:hypothetical protein
MTSAEPAESADIGGPHAFCAKLQDLGALKRTLEFGDGISLSHDPSPLTHPLDQGGMKSQTISRKKAATASLFQRKSTRSRTL